MELIDSDPLTTFSDPLKAIKINHNIWLVLASQLYSFAPKKFHPLAMSSLCQENDRGASPNPTRELIKCEPQSRNTLLVETTN